MMKETVGVQAPKGWGREILWWQRPRKL